MSEFKEIIEECIAQKDFYNADRMKRIYLEYRRENGIFEVGDKVVFSDHFMHNDIMSVSCIDGLEMCMDDGAKWTHNFNDMVRHATDEEIAAGHIL